MFFLIDIITCEISDDVELAGHSKRSRYASDS